MSELDIIDELLSNEKPKKSSPAKNANTKIKPESDFVDVKLSFETKYITEEEWIALGKPAWNYTTAKIKQFKRNTLAYKETQIEYYRAAILYLKLTNKINWWSEVDEDRLNLCRKELAKFKATHKLSKGDIAEINEIVYNHDYSRKSMVTQLTAIAKDVLEIKQGLEKDSAKKKALNLHDIAKIPSNSEPKLEFVKVENTEQQTTAATTVDAVSISPFACDKHPKYSGMRKPRSGCYGCIKFYNENVRSGKKEKRVKKSCT